MSRDLYIIDFVMIVLVLLFIFALTLPYRTAPLPMDDLEPVLRLVNIHVGDEAEIRINGVRATMRGVVIRQFPNSRLVVVRVDQGPDAAIRFDDVAVFTESLTRIRSAKSIQPKP